MAIAVSLREVDDPIARPKTPIADLGVQTPKQGG
jgi:hypothetical protein